MSEATEKLVVVIEPDGDMRADVVRQLSDAGFPTRDYLCGEDFLIDLQRLDEPSYFCLVTEMRLGGLSGLDLQRRLLSGPHVAATIFYVASAHIRDVVRVMRDGAIAVIEKNDGMTGLLTYVEEALDFCCEEFHDRTATQQSLEQLQSLNAGEQEVLRGIMTGKLNKEIAQELSLSIRTIEQRRREVFRKLGVKHPASLACKVMDVARAQVQQRLAPSEFWPRDTRVDAPSLIPDWRPRHTRQWTRRTV